MSHPIATETPTESRNDQTSSSGSAISASKSADTPASTSKAVYDDKTLPNNTIQDPEKAQHSHNVSASTKAWDPAFEVKFVGPDDPLDPRNTPRWRAWVMVLIVSATSLCVTCVSSLYTTVYRQMIPELETSEIVATLGLSLYIAGLGLGPLIQAPLSEFFGRRPIFLVSMTLFCVWLVPCAVAQNMATMLVSRFFDGFVGAAFLTVAGGTVGDLFKPSELQAPMMIYTASPFLGPEVGPVVGGFINQYTNWRWSFWVLLIWAGTMLIAIFFFCTETYAPVVLRNQARKRRKTSGDTRWHAPIEKSDRSLTKTLVHSIYRPVQLLIFDQMVLCLCCYSALLLGIVYLFFGAFDLIYTNNYGFELWQVGLTFLGMFVGMILGIATDPFWKRIYFKLIAKREAAGGEPGKADPEFRLPPAVVASPLVSIGLFWFAWTTFPWVHWMVSIVGSGVFGMGLILSFSGTFTYLVDAYPLYGASALASNSLARSSWAAAFPLFGPYMYAGLGYQWATTVLAFVSLLMLPFPYIFFRYGERIRKRSRFAQS